LQITWLLTTKKNLSYLALHKKIANFAVDVMCLSQTVWLYLYFLSLGICSLCL